MAKRRTPKPAKSAAPTTDADKVCTFAEALATQLEVCADHGVPPHPSPLGKSLRTLYVHPDYEPSIDRLAAHAGRDRFTLGLLMAEPFDRLKAWEAEWNAEARIDDGTRDGLAEQFCDFVHHANIAADELRGAVHEARIKAGDATSANRDEVASIVRDLKCFRAESDTALQRARRAYADPRDADFRTLERLRAFVGRRIFRALKCGALSEPAERLSRECAVAPPWFACVYVAAQDWLMRLHPDRYVMPRTNERAREHLDATCALLVEQLSEPPQQLTQAEFADLAGLDKTTVSRRVSEDPTFALTMPHALELRRQMVARKRSRRGGGDPGIYWECSGCGERAKSVSKPTRCPTCRRAVKWNPL